ncbi:MAG: helix-turn-helix domain-containing protein [Eubacteriales bacterium]
MDWITGMQQALNYIEEHLTEDLDYREIAAQAYSSAYHFQRVFGILYGCTLGEYIRNRRLSLAGLELQTGGAKVIDVALKYGYSSPDSFAKAFQKFHGIPPSQARSGAVLKSYSRLSLKFSVEGGNFMDYRIENVEEFTLVGYRRRFEGSPANRQEQVACFYMDTRLNQYALDGMAQDCVTNYNVMTNFDDNGYDFYIAKKMNTKDWEMFAEALEEDAKRFERLVIPSGLYLICETQRCQWPTLYDEGLRKKAVTEWLPSAGYELTDAPELLVYHWFRTDDNRKYERYNEVWLPIVKRK